MAENRTWTPERLEDVFARRAAGESLKSIGQSYDVCAERIRQVISREQRTRRVMFFRMANAPLVISALKVLL
jgi:predicted nucleic acid-binding Zn ribbon protein